MKDFFHHIFLPRESNNHRSKLLHHDSILFVIAILLVGQFFITFTRTHLPLILGAKVDISSQELLLFTNQKRQEEKLSALVLNDELSKAAYLKAKDMFAKGYWAHTSPDGVTPWFYFKQVGYDYSYAGENLARGFTTSNAVVDAWMKSPTHRENVLSGNYNEVGFAIVQGTLAGEETTLIVEMFGGKNKPLLAKKPNNDANMQKTSVPIGGPAVASVMSQSLIDSSVLSKNIAIIALSVFIMAFILDMLVIERKKIARLVGHNIDHIAFLGVLLLFVVLFTKGIVF